MLIISQNWEKNYYFLTGKAVEVTDKRGKQNIS